MSGRIGSGGTASLAALVAVALAASVLAAPAGAAVAGQLASWGKFGTGKGAFSGPGMLGVDPEDGSVYTGDVSADRLSFRIQKLSPSGAFIASTSAIPRFTEPPTPENEKKAIVRGIAVDSDLDRIYVLEGGEDELTANKTFASRIRVFSTVPVGSELVAPSGGPATLPLPEGADLLYLPRTIAVDPSNHDVVVMAERQSPNKRTVIQRVSAAGAIGARFVDEANVLRNATLQTTATAMAVGPDGTVYAVSGSGATLGTGIGKTHTRGWRLAPGGAKFEAIPGFAAAAESEGWPFVLENDPGELAIAGPNIAISPDGGTLYWKDRLAKSSFTTVGNVIVRGFSLEDAATTVVYGGSAADPCLITDSRAGVAVTGEGSSEKVVVFDYGPDIGFEEEAEEEGEEEGGGGGGPEAPPYGYRVLTFGAGGSGCPVPVARFTVNGVEGDTVEVETGKTVSFDASLSQITSGVGEFQVKGFRRELIWDFGDGETATVKGEGGKEAAATVAHQYDEGGSFQVSLQIRLKQPDFGHPQPVTHSLSVKGGKRTLAVTKGGTGTGTVKSTPAGIDCGSLCGAEYEEATPVTLKGTPGPNTKAVVWGGCDSIVGANECKVTMSAAKDVTATFDLEGHQLKVTKSGTGAGTVKSTPAGIDCGSACATGEASFAHGTAVTLKGTPDANVKAVAWSGCDSIVGANECKVTMSAAKNVTATFELEGHLLKATKAGTGTGTVKSTPTGIDCGSACATGEASFAHGADVVLKGTSDPNVKAVAWSGCDSIVGANECKVTMSAAKNVTATFDLVSRLLKVVKNGSGTGTVTSTPAGIECGEACAAGEASFNHGTLVKLTGAPGPNSKAVAWEVCPGTVNASNQCEVTLDAAKEAKATFDLEGRLLKVTKSGTGAGTVKSTPAGIDCGSACATGEASFAHGTAVTLKGTPDANVKAVAWSGCDSIVGANECKVTMSAAKNVTATFDLVSRLLKVVKSGTGTGTVKSTPAGIDCGSVCEASFNHGTLVRLTGTPDADTEPTAWTGCDAVTPANECEVTMGAAKDVTATFTRKTPQLSVALAGSGTGSVKSTPAGIDCGADCDEKFAYGALVKLSGTPGGGSKPVFWSGCDAVSGANQCEVTMTAAKSVTASFSPLDANALLVSKAGTGTGTVTSAPAGIDCGEDCAQEYAEGTPVKLSAVSGPDTEAVEWAGCDAVNGSNQCEVTMSAEKSVTATFDLEQRQLGVAVAGDGTVTSTPAGIECGADCAQAYDHGTLVTLTGAPGPNTQAVAWEVCPGAVNASNQCEVTMDAAKGAKATFDPEQRQLGVAVAGDGTVTSLPAGIECGADCAQAYDHGTLVTLTGAPGPNTQAVVWEECPGAVNGSNQCEVTMDAAKEARARFDLEQRRLAVTKLGSGLGTVAGPGIDCGSDCGEEYPHGTVVTLDALSGPGTKPVAWEGCDSNPTPGQCTVTLDADREVTATFAPIGENLLSVDVGGTGTGTVTSAPAGIDCGEDCSEEFAEGTPVVLTGAPGPNTQPIVWEVCPGNENVAGECEVTMDAAKEARATFDLEQRQLGVTVGGAGSGTVTSAPAGIDCGADCAQAYDHGTLVTLTGAPGPNTQAVAWEVCPGTVNASNQCEVTMDAAKEARARFDPEQRRLGVTVTGSGTVSSAPGGIACGSTCEADFDHGSLVTLTGTPAPGSKAVVWEVCPGTVNFANQCEVTMDAAKEAKATFDLVGRQLAVTLAGSGGGTVTGPGIDCGSDCGEEYSHGTVVTLSAASEAGSKPVFWTGCTPKPTPTECEVTMDAARNVTATFSPLDLFPLALTKAGGGSGTVVSAPAGIDCGAGCASDVHEYVENTGVVLTATSGPHTLPVVWSGCVIVTANECEVTMSAARNVTATFPAEQRRLTVTKLGAGRGYVGSLPAGIACGGTCEAEFDHGRLVTLSGLSDASTQAVVWQSCPGTVNGANECQVTVDQATAVVALFESIQAATSEGESEASVEADEASTLADAPAVAKGAGMTRKERLQAKRRRALARCNKRKGKARQRCIERAQAIGKANTKKKKRWAEAKRRPHGGRR